MLVIRWRWLLDGVAHWMAMITKMTLVIGWQKSLDSDSHLDGLGHWMDLVTGRWSLDGLGHWALVIV